ncbi:MAG: DUF4364 family protein [Acutalibacteraceae bacterium]|nr:DUF4364 family protein [Acutalibacteraceae bacterium]
MEKDAISVNVGKGGLKNTAEIKILVLYLLMNVTEPVPSNQICDLLHLEGIANTFELNEAFAQLHQNGLIDETDEGIEFYAINDKGRDVGQTLQSSVPFTVREKSLKLLKKMLLRNRHMKETDIKIHHEDDGSIKITCSAIEGDSVIMSFTLQAADDAQAIRIRENFLDDPALIYRTLIDMLTK